MNGKQLKNSILQWAIQGKLVPQDPNDEPARVLLDKIRQEKERLIKEKKIKRDKNASIIYRGEDNSYYEKILATGEVKCIDEDIPFEVPQGWEWERFGNIMINKDSERIPLSVAQRQQLKKTYDYYGASGVIDKVDKYLFDKDLLLIGEDGANLINRSTPIAFIAKGKYWVNNHAHVLDVCSGMALSYVALFINAISLVDYVTGTAQPKMNQEKMNSILLAIPPVKEQHRILEKMSTVDAFVDKYASLQTKMDSLDNYVYELLRKSILQEAIQGKLVPQIASEGTAHELLEQIKAEKQKLVKEGKLKKSALNDSVIFKGDDNKYWEKKGTTCECIDEDIPFDIPKSWAWARLETILNTGSARRVHAKDWRQAGIPFYRAREIGKLADEGFVDNELYIDLSLYEDFSSSGVPLPNDLMITAVGTLGKVYIVKKSDKFYYKDGSVLCLANKYGLCAEYLKMVIESPFFKGQYRQESQGTTVATLTMVRLQKYLIPIPPLQEQYRIVETYRNIASIMSR